MEWIIYFGIIMISVLIPFIICSFAFEKQNDSFLGRYNSSVIKGIGILCVMLCHFMGRFGEGTTIFTPFGGIGVAIFLVMSAYGLHESWKIGGGQYYWRKRIIAVIIPYLIIQCVLYWPFHDFSIKDFILDVICFAPKYSNGWYLNYIMMWYLIFYVVMRVDILRNHKITVFSLISVILFFTLRELKAEQSLSFLTGILLSEFKDSKVLQKRFNWTAGLVLFVVGIFALGLKQTPFIRDANQILFNFVQLMIKLPCGLAICTFAVSLEKKLNLKFFAIVGSVSYELYLIHGYVLEKVPVSIMGEVIFIALSVVMAATLHLLLKYSKNIQRKVFAMK